MKWAYGVLAEICWPRSNTYILYVCIPVFFSKFERMTRNGIQNNIFHSHLQFVWRDLYKIFVSILGFLKDPVREAEIAEHVVNLEGEGAGGREGVNFEKELLSYVSL